ncbi:hypothetical protein GCM10020254_55700 [Streptomyces goshikiensis]
MLLTTDDTSRRAHYRNAYRTLDQLLAMGALPVVNENDTVATDEIRFGDNDRLAALVAHLVRADLLVLLSDVDGLYDGDPSQPGTTRIDEVHGPEDIAHVSIGSAGKAGVGTGGMVTKVEAARIAAAAGIPVVLTSASQAADALAGRATGTLFHATGRRSADRLLWLQHASTPRDTSYSTTAPSAPSPSAAARCWPPASRRSRATSSPATRSNCAPPPATLSPGAWSTSTPRSSRSCWAAPPATSRGNSDPRTSGRSSTVTIWSCCRAEVRQNRRAVAVGLVNCVGRTRVAQTGGGWWDER